MSIEAVVISGLFTLCATVSWWAADRVAANELSSWRDDA